MKRQLAFASLIGAGLLLAPSMASAQRLPIPPAPAAPASHGGAGGGNGGSITPLAGYVMGATFCSAAFLWFRAYYVSRTQNRELTQGEAWETVGACFIPLIGGPIFRAFVEQYKARNALAMATVKKRRR